MSLKDLEREDTYSFNSEDDALFAEHLDMVEAQCRLDETEADMGRPIDSDEGIGGAIDFDEGRPDAASEHASTSASSKMVSGSTAAQVGTRSVNPVKQGQN